MSERKLVSIRTISDIKPIIGADRVELASIDGWRCVVLKGDCEVGQNVLFFETDSALINVSDPRFGFLQRCHKSWKIGNVVVGECYHIKTIKLAGQISQGLVLPIEQFKDEIELVNKGNISLCKCLNVHHFDDVQTEMNIRLGKSPNQQARGSFPAVVPKTDEERIQNCIELFDNCKDMPFEVTMKLDGSSMSVGYSPSYYPDDPYFVCSRNLCLKDGDDHFNRIARLYNLKNILYKHYEFSGDELCIQGELVGPSINGNRDKLNDFDYFVFRVRNITKDCWLEPTERNEFCRSNGLRHVPVLSGNMFAFNEFGDVESIVAFTNQFKTANHNPIEGLVFKSLDGNTSFKVLNPLYLLKNGM